MARIRKIEIENFRGIKSLSWMPKPGINCLIGPGDSGKSTVLDAIDWCVGARRSLPVTDADFHKLLVEEPIEIRATIGELEDGLKNFDSYGPYLLGMDDEGAIENEPGEGLETVLTVQLIIESDLEPRWSLLSDRAEAQGLTRGLSWNDRANIAPNRIGAYATHHLGWQKGSILNALNDEKADASAALAQAGRQARESFGDTAGEQLEETLKVVTEAAADLGIDLGDGARAMLDAHSGSFSGSTISLHDDEGVPLRKLGLGSSRLLVAGLQNHVAQAASIALVDEVEIGLEPHRITKFLMALGSKDQKAKIQVFMTTHSPVVLRELASTQLWVIRSGEEHNIRPAGETDAVQGTLRSAPEAFLGAQVLICEGATEVGLIRGLDHYRSDSKKPTFAAAGGVLVDAGGVSKIYRNALPFIRLGYTAAVLRDDDRQPAADSEEKFVVKGGVVCKWTDGWAFEDEMFDCLSEDAVCDLWDFAQEAHGEETTKAQLESACEHAVDEDEWFEDLTDEKRSYLAKAAKSGKWFKRISLMETAAHEIVGPDLPNAKEEFQDVINQIYAWAGVDDA